MQTGRLVALDGLRGIAAVAVLLHHLYIDILGLFSAAYLAVDFFFLLSGYVLARTYEQRLAEGMTFTGYMARRLRRLYPAIIAGTVLGAAVMAVWQPQQPIIWWIVAGLLMIPLTPAAMNGIMYPLNGVQWSLLFEIIANAIQPLLVRRWRNVMLAGVVLLGLAGLIAHLLTGQALYQGTRLDGFPTALARVAFSFFLGVAIFRIRTTGRLNMVRLPAWVSAVVLGIVLAAPSVGNPVLHDFVVIVAVWPALLVMTLSASEPKTMRPLAKFLGGISYPLYAVHFSVIHAFAPLLLMFGLSFTQKLALYGSVIVVAVVAAVLVERFVERPLIASRRFEPKLDQPSTPASSKPQ